MRISVFAVLALLLLVSGCTQKRLGDNLSSSLVVSLLPRCEPLAGPHPTDMYGDPSVVLHVTTESLFINDQAVSPNDLGLVLRDIYRTRARQTIFLLPDGAVSMTRIWTFIHRAQDAGLDRVICLTPKSNEELWRNIRAEACSYRAL